MKTRQLKLRFLGAALALTCGACGPGVEGLAPEGEAITTIFGRIEGERPQGNLRATILWENLGPPDSANVQLGGSGFFLGGGPFRPVEDGQGPSVRPDGTDIALPLQLLPTRDVVMSLPNGVLGLASLVLYDDVDNSGDLEMPLGCGAAGDRVLAASYSTILTSVTRITYLEGMIPETALLSRFLGCSPPPGFSVLTVGVDGCVPMTTSQVIPLTPQDPELLSFVRCPLRNVGDPEEPLDTPPPGTAFEACLDPNTAIFRETSDNPCACPFRRQIQLVGCEDPSSPCDEPDWEVEAPSWWPCSS